MNKISTKNGIYFFKEKTFTLGSKVINKSIAKENFFIFKKIMDKNNLKFILAYGTLLGAIREKDFITHDEDIDVIMLNEDRDNFIELLFKFREVGLEVVRNRDDLISIIRDDEYIDIYFFKKWGMGLRKNGKYRTKETFLFETKKYSFLGKEFDIPKDYIGYLEYHYGPDWNIPKKHAHSYIVGNSTKIKDFLRRKFSKSYSFLQKLFNKK